jgi:hypothetical protein
MKKFISTLVTCVLLSGCTTTYKGPRPDFSKTGAAAQTEYETFKVSESFGETNLYSVEMNKNRYFTDSIRPIMKEVSPNSEAQFQKMETIQKVSWGLLAVTLATLYQPKDSWAYTTGYWIGLSAVFGTAIYRDSIGMRAAEEYNKELKSKFVPSLTYRKSF